MKAIMHSIALPLAVLVTGSGCTGQRDILIADFEGETFGNWTAEGSAFGPGPATGTLEAQMEVSGYDGARRLGPYPCRPDRDERPR